MHSFQWMLNNCTRVLDFTLVDLHVALRCNQRPRVGNIAGRHVSMADMLVDDTVDLTYNKTLALHVAATAT